MHPVQGALHVGQSVAQVADDVAGGRNPEADAIDDAVEANRGAREHVHKGLHARCDVLELRLAEIADGPPRPRVDEREDLLSGVRVSAFGKNEVGDAGVEGRVDLAVVEVVLGGLHRGFARPALGSERIERG